MKKIIFLVVIVFLLVGCAGISKSSDAYIFKKEYESINGDKQGDKTIRSLNIPKDNPFVYKSASDIVEKIDNKSSFVVYFGFNKCPWCRSMINNLIDVSNDLDINEVYYVDILDIRDTKEVDTDGNIITTKEGSNDYYKLVEYFNDVLADYTFTNDDGEEINLGEKRIYAPNVIVVKNGKVIGLTTGTPDSLTDPYMKLTKKIKKESYNMLHDLLVKLNSDVCTKEGC